LARPPSFAGIFQFTPLKERCLRQCRSPFGFFVRYYRAGIGSAWRLGCCWALMLVMFGLVVSSLVSMAVLTGVMVMEKTFRGGRRLSPIIGVVLLLLALLWLVHPVWLPVNGV
jgi:predicted metal-binding membrane protein